MIARQEVDAAGELARQRRDQVEQLVRLVAAGGIPERAVDDLLQNEVPPRVMGEVGLLHQRLEVAEVAVQIAADEHISGVSQCHDAAGAAGRGAERRSCAGEGGQSLAGSGMRLMVTEPGRLTILSTWSWPGT